MSTYIIADPCFYNDEQREKAGFSSFKEMNDHIIKNWNSAITAEDDVIIMGRVGSGEKKQMKDLFSKLNGKLTSISGNLNKNFSKEEWKEIGFSYFWNVPMYYDLNEEQRFLYINYPINSQVFKEYQLVVVDSENPIEGMTQGNLFSADALKWDYTPLNTDNLYEIFQNMKEFEEMENSEQHSDIKEVGEE